MERGKQSKPECVFFRKHKLFFVYGKWTEFIKYTDYASYEEYLKENSHKFKRDGDKSKSPSDSPSHTSRKVLQKLNSLKVSPFKSSSSQEVSLLGDRLLLLTKVFRAWTNVPLPTFQMAWFQKASPPILLTSPIPRLSGK